MPHTSCSVYSMPESKFNLSEHFLFKASCSCCKCAPRGGALPKLCLAFGRDIPLQMTIPFQSWPNQLLVSAADALAGMLVHTSLSIFLHHSAEISPLAIIDRTLAH